MILGPEAGDAGTGVGPLEDVKIAGIKLMPVMAAMAATLLVFAAVVVLITEPEPSRGVAENVRIAVSTTTITGVAEGDVVHIRPMSACFGAS
jgi:hypothetical protein